MKISEALEEIKEILAESTRYTDSVCYVTDNDKEPLEIAIKALEKQIPRKTDVKIHNEDTRIGSVIFQSGTKVHYCPQCRMLVTGSDKYCRNCGQALIW